MGGAVLTSHLGPAPPALAGPTLECGSIRLPCDGKAVNTASAWEGARAIKTRVSPPEGRGLSWVGSEQSGAHG